MVTFLSQVLSQILNSILIVWRILNKRLTKTVLLLAEKLIKIISNKLENKFSEFINIDARLNPLHCNWIYETVINLDQFGAFGEALIFGKTMKILN